MRESGAVSRATGVAVGSPAAGDRPSGRAARAAGGVCAQTLPLLTGRVNAQVVITECCDGVRLTGCCGRRNAKLRAVLAVGAAYWGAPVEGWAGPWFQNCLRWPNGALVEFSEDGPDVPGHQNPGRMALVLSGSVLAEFDGEEQKTVVREFVQAGLMEATRFDAAVDVRGQSVCVVEAFVAESEPERATMRGFKCRDPHRPTSGGKVTGHTLYLGKRGRLGSGRMMRTYDKGLEQGGRANQWHRVEVEYTKAAANLAMLAWLGGGPGIEAATIGQLVCGAVDFRIPRADGKRPRRVDELERPAWWSQFIDAVCGDPVKVRPTEPRTPNADSHARWMWRCVWKSVLRVASAAGVSPEAVLALSRVESAGPPGGPLSPREFEQVRLLRKRKAVG